MLDNTFPLLVALLQNATVCLENILEEAQFETVALVHLNTTVDVADIIHQQLIADTDYAWMRFDMTDSSKLKSPLLMDNLFTKIFFVYFLDDFQNWVYVFKFIVLTQLNHRDNHIYVVSKYPTVDYMRSIARAITGRHFFNAAILFWNTSGHDTGLEAHTFNGFQNDTIKIPLVNGLCSSDMYSKMFFDKLMNFYGLNVTIYGQTEPPRIIRTVSSAYEYSIGGHDVLITDAIFRHLNARPNYKLIGVTIFTHSYLNSSGVVKPVNNIEQQIFNVSQISRYDWRYVNETEKLKKIYVSPGIDFKTQQMRYSGYMETLRLKDFTYLYPHDTDNFVIIVPKRFKSKTEYDHIFKSPLVLVWVPVTVAATITRFILKKIKKTDKDLAELFFQTFGLSLGMSFNAVLASAAENLLLWWFCLGTMLSGMLLSSSMFQGFALQHNILTISNLKDLEMSGIEVQAPIYIESVSNFFENIPQKLNLKYSFDFEISEMISNRNTSNAYVIREGKFNFMFDNDNDIWHVIQRFGFEYLSYKLHFFSSIENRMNTVVQRCVDHGIIKYLVAKNKRLLTGIKSNDQNAFPTTYSPLAIIDMKNPYLLYVFGILLSTITLIAERIYFKFTN